MTYEEVCRNFNEIISFLEKDHYETVFNQIDQTVVRREQATGGGVMHRGYYCPSLVMDIAIGNVNRGRLIKRLRTQKITYTYGFDALDRLVTVVNHTEVGDFLSISFMKATCNTAFNFIIIHGRENISTTFQDAATRRAN